MHLYFELINFVISPNLEESTDTSLYNFSVNPFQTQRRDLHWEHNVEGSFDPCIYNCFILVKSPSRRMTFL